MDLTINLGTVVQMCILAAIVWYGRTTADLAKAVAVHDEKHKRHDARLEQHDHQLETIRSKVC